MKRFVNFKESMQQNDLYLKWKNEVTIKKEQQ